MARIRKSPIPWADKFEKNEYKDMRRGAVEDAFWDEDELVDYRPGSKRKGRKKGCKRSKTGEKCDFSATTVVGTEYVYERKVVDGKVVRYADGCRPRTINCCSRCGKYDWSSYRWSYLY